MFLIDISSPLSIIIAVILTLCTLLLAKETKNSILMAITLGVFIVLLVMHTIQLTTLSQLDLAGILRNCLIVDFIFILLSYISYLWIDEIETKYKNKKSIDNSLDWFWKKI